MGKYILYVIFLISINYSFGQTPQYQKNSTYQYCFKITASEAFDIAKTNIIPFQKLESQNPDFIYSTKTNIKDSLPIGFYIVVMLDDLELKANLFIQSNLFPYSYNHLNKLLLQLRDLEGKLIENPTAALQNKTVPYNDKLKGFYIKNRNLNHKILLLSSTNDTTIYEIEKETRSKSFFLEKWQRVKSTKIGRAMMWLPGRVMSIWNYKYQIKKRRGYSKKTYGYLIFNQPKYKLGDTVRWKTFLVNKNGKPIQKKLEVLIKYFNKGKSIIQNINTLYPNTKGNYFGQFYLSDTLPNDSQVYVELVDKKNKKQISDDFKIEDYVLNEVTTHKMEPNKNEYYKGDSIKIKLSVKDANNLHIMDGKVHLVLLNKTINDIFDSIGYVPDTLYSIKKELNTTADTEIIIATNDWPYINAQIQVKAIFSNSNNEQQIKSDFVSYKSAFTKITTTKDGDSLEVDFLVNNISKKVNAQYSINHKMYNITLPSKLKVNTTVDKYEFYYKDTITGKLYYEYFKPKNDINDVQFERIATADSAGFILYNSNKHPIQYALYKKGRVMQKGFFENEKFQWVKAFNENEIWELEYSLVTNDGSSYYKTRKQTIALIKHILQVKIDSKENIQPGEKDKINISVHNYRNKAMNNVNLTAVSYNQQFSKDVQLPNLPNLQLYKTKKPFVYKDYSIDEASASNKLNAGANSKWIEKLGEKHNLYYQLLSTEKTKVQRYATRDSITQIVVHLLQNGIPIPINLIYIDNVLVYYSGTSIPLPMSFKTTSGYKNIKIRTYNKEYEFKNVLVIEKNKNEFFYNVGDLDLSFTTIIEMPLYYTPKELNLLNSTLLKVKNDYGHADNWIWQNDKVYKIAYTYNDLLLGPLMPYNNVHFYKPNSYINTFKMEPGYNYVVGEKKVKMVKEDFYNTQKKYNVYAKYPNTLLVYDSVLSLPTINLDAKQINNRPFIANIADYSHTTTINDGKLFVELPKDTVIQFLYLKPKDTSNHPLIFTTQTKLHGNIMAGNYSLNIMTNNGWYLYYDNIPIKKDSTFFLDLSKQHFTTTNKNFFIISNTNQVILADSIIRRMDKKISLLDSIKTTGNYLSQYVGRVLDASGTPIAFASVRINGRNMAVATNLNGEFLINANENDELIFTSVGYNGSSIKLTSNKTLTIFLSNASSRFEDVVVTGYGTKKKASLTSARTTISGDFLKSMPGVEMDKMLQGKAAGISIQSAPDMRIRGIGTLDANNKPLYVVDGILTDDISKLDPTSFSTVETLKDAAASAIYGSRGINGVVLITTEKVGYAFRKEFKDYAIWQPNLTTNKDGKASFEVTYPDNITGWQMYVLAMDGKKRIGQTSKLVTAYKPLVAQLSIPQFLLQGDTAFAIGKVVNYTNDMYNVLTSVNEISSRGFDLKPKSSYIETIGLIANNTTTIETKFAIQTKTGFKDAEIRTLPVMPIGTFESNGNFWVLTNDTTVSYKSQNLSNKITITAHNNTIDVLLAEIENIKNYSYYCMEQIASKLMALQAEKEIRKHLNQPFKEDKLITKLTNKLLKAQLYNGGWSWWGGENGNANLFITHHVLNALLPQKEDAIIQNAIQNGTMYMHSKLVDQKPIHQIPTLLLLRKLNNKNVDYKSYLEKISFDSLSLQEQFQYVLLKQLEQLPYEKEMSKLKSLKKETILGGIYWEDKNNCWYNDANINTVLAYQMLKNYDAKEAGLVNIFQYFLEQKRRGYWMNTYTAISILQTILPDVLASTSYKTSPSIQVAGDTTFTINSFPFTKQLENVKQLQFSKQGTGLMYFSAYETYFNTAPSRIEKDFIVTTTMLQKGEKVNKLKANENTTLQLQILCNKEADYVMIELPIPAGCIYNAKNQDYRIVHTEFFKDKVVLFAEKLAIGKHDFSFELQTRYNGTYTLNPAKVSLMYYPIFYGREALKKVKIEE